MKYDVKFSCGHTETIELFGKTKDREDRIKYFEERGVCSECYRERCKAENAKAAAAIVREYSLPEITGVSEKQIAYASDLRARYLAEKAALVASYFKQRSFEGTDKMVANLHSQAQRKGGKAMLAEYRTHMLRYEYLPVLFCTGDARRIIDCLTGRY